MVYQELLGYESGTHLSVESVDGSFGDQKYQ
jgi:hypothetical protein